MVPWSCQTDERWVWFGKGLRLTRRASPRGPGDSWTNHLPDLLLVLAPDKVRMHHAGRLLTGARELVLLALEKNAALTSHEQPVWRLASLNTVVSLRRAMSRVKPDGELPKEPPLSNPLLPNDLPVLDGGFDVPDQLLPAVLKPA